MNRDSRQGLTHPSTPRIMPVSLAAAALLAYGGYEAFSQAWLCDDSFISIRYAQNLLDGHGLVYNAGEHVEDRWLKLDVVSVGIDDRVIEGLSDFGGSGERAHAGLLVTGPARRRYDSGHRSPGKCESTENAS